ncbi:MAG: GNAT family N-acetyltransferase [Planctomycetes bacterium]|nr:GNAT family N-acetyltransferase [Planctomycetota bacterium]
MDISELEILPAGEADLQAILDLQHRAYRSEAELLNDFSIPPLQDTLEDTRQDYSIGIILKAVTPDGEIIGSVRGHVEAATLCIGKLMVLPEYRGQGLGTRLLTTIEKYFPVFRCELFTSSKSTRNMALYERLGYVRYKEEMVAPGLQLVYFHKTNAFSL